MMGIVGYKSIDPIKSLSDTKSSFQHHSKEAALVFVQVAAT
jgi:hypothetical protein